jgi:hypothetical protein
MGNRWKPNAWDNWQSVAQILAAIESARTGQTVAVQQYLQTTQQQLT